MGAPAGCCFMALTQKVDAIVPMGVLIKGDTDHYDMIKECRDGGPGRQLTTGVLSCAVSSAVTPWSRRRNARLVTSTTACGTAIEMATRNTQMGKVCRSSTPQFVVSSPACGPFVWLQAGGFLCTIGLSSL